MANERLRLEMIDPTEKMYIGDNPLDKFTSAINFVDSTNNDHGPPGSRFPAYIIAGLIDLLKLPVVLIRDELADAEEQKLNYNITLLKELLPTCKNQKNIENLHKYYTDKTEFKGLTMTLLKDCMVERACQPLPDDDQEKIDKIDFKGGSFKRMLRDKLKEITN